MACFSAPRKDQRACQSQWRAENLKTSSDAGLGGAGIKFVAHSGEAWQVCRREKVSGTRDFAEIAPKRTGSVVVWGIEQHWNSC